jgi:hypothetical protein
MHGHLICRLPSDQDQISAFQVGRLVAMSLQMPETPGLKEYLLNDVTRAALVEYLNAANGARMRSSDLTEVGTDHRRFPIRVDNSLRYGDLWEILG